MRFLYLFTSCFFLLAPLTGQGLQDGLVFYAPFDVSTVNLVEWVKPRNHGASFTADKFGYANRAISFDGSDDYLDYGDLLNLGRQNFSVSLWVKVESPGGRMASKGTMETPRGFNLVSVLTEGGNSFGFIATDENTPKASSGFYGFDQNDYALGEWCHLVVTRAGEKTQLYLNSELIAAETVEQPALVDSNAPFVIGAALWEDGKTADHYFQGDLDEVRVYNRRLSLRDITLLYDQFLNGPEGQGMSKKSVAPLSLEVTTYPNPTSRILNLEFDAAAPRKIRILDPSGRMIRYQKIFTEKEEIPVAGLPPGTYYIRIEEGDRFVVKRFLKVGAVIP